MMPMDPNNTTSNVQRYLDELRNLQVDDLAEPVVRALLERSVNRIRLLCGALLYRSYPRLTRWPTNLDTDEMLSAVVERLIKAMRSTRPETVRQFFALANQHMRWELNDLVRRLDKKEELLVSPELSVPAPLTTNSSLSVNTQRILLAIEQLPDDLRETFSLVRIQGLAQTEVAELLSISQKTVHRRLSRSLILLEQQLADLEIKD